MNTAVMLKWTNLRFSELSLEQLYQVLALRQQVFVVEQNCPYLDVDGQDQHARHLLGYQQQELLAYARVFSPDEQGLVRIGRVITAANARQQGLGLALMQIATQYCQQQWPLQRIQLSAQQHLQGFYGKLGYYSVGEPYLEDGIPHIAMVLNAKIPS